jgi:hypothetical protein
MVFNKSFVLDLPRENLQLEIKLTLLEMETLSYLVTTNMDYQKIANATKKEYRLQHFICDNIFPRKKKLFFIPGLWIVQKHDEYMLLNYSGDHKTMQSGHDRFNELDKMKQTKYHDNDIMHKKNTKKKKNLINFFFIFFLIIFQNESLRALLYLGY